MRKRSRSQSGNREEGETRTEPPPQLRYEASADESLINVSCSLVHLVWEQGKGQGGDGHSNREPSRLAGEIKTLYTDFTVRELDPSTGLPCRLTSIDPLPEDVPQTTDAEANSGAPLEEETVRSAFRSFVSSDADVEALVKFALAPSRKQPFEGTVPMGEKETRTLFHQTVRKVLGSKFDSSTTDDQRMKVIYVGLKGAKPRGGSWGNGGRNATEWPAGRPEHLHFTVYKENIDSTSMLRQVATKIGLPQKAIMFAGTKDKRGVTLQRCSVHKVSSFKVAEGVNRGRGGFGPNCKVKVGNFAYCSNPIKLGAVTGNRFEVLIRHLSLPPNKGPAGGGGSSLSSTAGENTRLIIRETVSMILNTVKEFGFINYFGPQRFGTTSIPTSEVGCRLLAGKYKDVVRMVLQSKAEFVPQIRAVLAAVDQGNYAEALELTPHFCFTERDMLRSLSDSKGSFEAAVTALPRPLTMLYCHAVQSLVWNEFVGRRLRLSATSVLVGDLVRCGGTSAQQDVGVDVDGADGDLVDGVDPNEEKFAASATVKIVTADDLAANLYSISDVVLPVVGPDEALLFPHVEAVSRQAMAEYLTSIGATPLLDASAHLTKKFHFHGTYRTVLEHPKDLAFSFLEYDTENQQLVETDWMTLNHEPLGRGAVGGKGQPAVVEGNEEATTELPTPASPPERLLAAKVEFSLGPGSYATSLLRELLLPRTRTHS